MDIGRFVKQAAQPGTDEHSALQAAHRQLLAVFHNYSKGGEQSDAVRPKLQDAAQKTAVYLAKYVAHLADNSNPQDYVRSLYQYIISSIDNRNLDTTSMLGVKVNEVKTPKVPSKSHKK